MGNLLPIQWTLKTKVIMVVVTTVLLTTTVIAAVSFYIMKRDIKTLFKDQQYTMVKMIAAAIDEGFQTRRIAVNTLAHGLPISARNDSQQLQSYLVSHSSLTALFYNFSIFSAQGTLLANLRDPSEIGKHNFAEKEYIRRTLEQKKGIISEPIFGQLSARPIVVVTEPVFDEQGRVALIFIGSIDLQRADFINQFTNTPLGKQGFIYIVTSKGIVIDHADKTRILKHVDNAGGKSSGTDRALAGFEGSMEGISRRGDPAIYAFQRLHMTDWIVGAIYLQREAFVPIRNIQDQGAFITLILALVAGWLAWLVMARLMAPMHALHRHIQKIRSTKTYDPVPVSYRQDEIGDLGRAFNALMQERKDTELDLAQAQVNLEAMNKTLERLALEDDLTGLANRRRFDLSLRDEFNRAIREGSSLALVMIDVDHFKPYNDLYGHLAGDQCLRKVGRIIKQQQTRSSDLMARYGGEEIVILLPNSDELAAIAVAQRIRLAVRQLQIKHEGNEAGIVTISAGVSAMQPIRDITVPEELVSAADRALYLAKTSGRDCVRSSLDLLPARLVHQ